MSAPLEVEVEVTLAKRRKFKSDEAWKFPTTAAIAKKDGTNTSTVEDMEINPAPTQTRSSVGTSARHKTSSGGSGQVGRW